ncbi:response regulator [Aquabacter spiritensis]|uniref:GAF domain-containing protein n=1 Tax=Aquabacter spiritensis TaxID=933073 RepID=A0A4R3M3W5_9HYPH|nr:response regulator [Aquabacter spiritensis]TCT07964.1 GAF domain-containing protein [Aquabacter spiritensis]
MATILIVDDHAVNREVLVSLLKHGGHRLTEAADGSAALEAAREVPPDLIISDILMPSGDGYELVRNLRREPGLARVPVIFYTAHFNAPEAMSLARSCGVRHVLTKPAEPEKMLSTVESVLAEGALKVEEMSPAALDEQQMRVVSDKLAETTGELERMSSRLMALIEMSLQIAAEREPDSLVQTFCRWTRDLVAARHAIVALWSHGADPGCHIAVSGLSDEAAQAVEAGLMSSAPQPAPLSATGPMRRAGPVADADQMGLPWAYPPVGGMLVVPVRSPTRQLGWVCATSKVGGEAFSEEDERLLGIFAAYLARTFENDCLLSEVSERTRRLEEEIARRSESQWRAELQYAIAHVLAATSHIEDAAPDVLKVICQKAGFTCGELWEVVADDAPLRLVGLWHPASETAGAFLSATRAAAFLRGVGMPGRAWDRSAPVWIPDVRADPGFLRGLTAAGAGLQAALALPALVGGRVVGIIGFFGPSLRTPAPDLIDLFATIGGQVGQFIERRAQELQLKRLAAPRTREA